MKYPLINKWYDHEIFGRIKILKISDKKDSILVENSIGEKRLCCGWDGEEQKMLSRFNDL